MASVHSGEEILPKASTPCVGCTNVTDRQTERRQTTDRRICDSKDSNVTYSHVRVKTADRIRMPFGIIGRTGPRMRQVLGFRIGPREGVLLGYEFGARHCNQWGLYALRVRQRRDAGLFRNYFGQICYYCLSEEVFLERSVCMTVYLQLAFS